MYQGDVCITSLNRPLLRNNRPRRSFRSKMGQEHQEPLLSRRRIVEYGASATSLHGECRARTLLVPLHRTTTSTSSSNNYFYIVMHSVPAQTVHLVAAFFLIGVVLSRPAPAALFLAGCLFVPALSAGLRTYHPPFQVTDNCVKLGCQNCRCYRIPNSFGLQVKRIEPKVRGKNDSCPKQTRQRGGLGRSRKPRSTR